MVATHTGFKYNIDYIVLEVTNDQYMIQNLQEDSMDTMYPLNSSKNGRGINYNCVYLTLSGNESIMIAQTIQTKLG